MARTKVDPAALSGAALGQWYRRTPAEIEEERRREEAERYDAFVASISDEASGGRSDREQIHAGGAPAAQSSTPSWQDAKGPPPPPPQRVQPPRGSTVGPSVDHPRGPPGEGVGFFGSHRPFGRPAWYNTPLPPPLDSVTQSQVRPAFWQLSDGTLVPTTEVERIHAWQQDRLAGGDDTRPWRRATPVDRLKDGVVPAASQLKKGEHEADPTCHPYGGWEIDPGFHRYPERSQKYEAQITRAPGIDYVVRAPGHDPVKYDGCAVWSPRKELLEAKGPGYAGLLARAFRSTFGDLMTKGLHSQANRQAAVAAGRPVDWHAAEEQARESFDRLLPKRPSMRFLHTPAR